MFFTSMGNVNVNEVSGALMCEIVAGEIPDNLLASSKYIPTDS